MKDPSLIVSILALLVSLVGVIVSYIVARKYGDVAALSASRKLHEEDTRKARLTALRSLSNEVMRIRVLVDFNKALDPNTQMHSIARMPVAAFESAFVSGTQSLDVSDELLHAVAVYLVWADGINSLVDIYPFSIAGYGTGGVKPGDIAREIATDSEKEILGALHLLETSLQKEIQRVQENA